MVKMAPYIPYGQSELIGLRLHFFHQPFSTPPDLPKCDRQNASDADGPPTYLRQTWPPLWSSFRQPSSGCLYRPPPQSHKWNTHTGGLAASSSGAFLSSSLARLHQ